MVYFTRVEPYSFNSTSLNYYKDIYEKYFHQELTIPFLRLISYFNRYRPNSKTHQLSGKSEPTIMIGVRRSSQTKVLVRSRKWVL